LNIALAPLGVGTLIVKPKRHVVHVWDLNAEEAEELGPLLRRTALALAELTAPEQVYVTLWSHMHAVPGHIHFVVQSVTRALMEEHDGKHGIHLQVGMFDRKVAPPNPEVELISSRVRAWFDDDDG